MPQWGYLIIAIAVLLVLGVTALLLFLAYRKTPLPAGCEELKANEGKCVGCEESSCPFAKKKEGEE